MAEANKILALKRSSSDDFTPPQPPRPSRRRGERAGSTRGLREAVPIASPAPAATPQPPQPQAAARSEEEAESS